MTRIARDVPPYFLAEGNPAEVYGLNSVGLRRRNFAAEMMAELKDAYKTHLSLGQQLAAGDRSAARGGDKPTPAASLLAFLEAPSERGILK